MTNGNMDVKENIQTSMDITSPQYCNHKETSVDKKTKRQCNIPSIRSIMMVLCTFYCQFLSVGVATSSGVYYSEILRAYPDEPKRSVAFALSLFSGAWSVGGIFSGMAINRFGTKMTLFFGAVVCSLGLIASFFANGVVYLMMSYGLVAGIGSCVICMTSMVALRQHFGSEAKIPITFASLGSGVGVTTVVQLTDAFVQAFGWRGSFFLFAGLFLQICIMALTLPIHRQNITRTSLANTSLIQWSVLKNPRYASCLVITLLYTISMGMFLTVLLDYGKQMQFTEKESTLLISFVGLIGIPGRGFAAILSHFNKFSSLVTFCLSGIFLGCGLVFLKYSSSYDLAFVFTFLVGFGNGIFILLIWIVPLDMFSQEYYPSASGFILIADGLGFLVSGPIAGFAFDVTGSYDLAFQPLAGFLIVMSFVIIAYELYFQFKQPSVIDTHM